MNDFRAKNLVVGDTAHFCSRAGWGSPARTGRGEVTKVTPSGQITVTSGPSVKFRFGSNGSEIGGNRWLISEERYGVLLGKQQQTDALAEIRDIAQRAFAIAQNMVRNPRTITDEEKGKLAANLEEALARAKAL